MNTYEEEMKAELAKRRYYANELSRLMGIAHNTGMSDAQFKEFVKLCMKEVKIGFGKHKIAAGERYSVLNVNRILHEERANHMGLWMKGYLEMYHDLELRAAEAYNWSEFRKWNSQSGWIAAHAACKAIARAAGRMYMEVQMSRGIEDSVNEQLIGLFKRFQGEA